MELEIKEQIHDKHNIYTSCDRNIVHVRVALAIVVFIIFAIVVAKFFFGKQPPNIDKSVSQITEVRYLSKPEPLDVTSTLLRVYRTFTIGQNSQDIIDLYILQI
jgi:hypothetical protein